MKSKEKERFLTTRQAAKRLGVNFRTIQNWVEKGVLRAWKTSGGHRRIAYDSVETFLKNRKNALQGNAEDKQQESLKILVFENDPEVQGIYEVYFERWNLPIKIAMTNNAMEGLVWMGRNKPHTVIANLPLPDIDGFAMLHTLQKNPIYREIQFIVVTNLSNAEISKQGGFPNPVLVLKKTTAFEQLEALIRARIQEVCH